MNLIIEKLDSELFTDEMKAELQESFDKELEMKAKEEALTLVESKEAEYETYIAEQIESHKEELASKLDTYLDQVVEEFVAENEMAMESELKRAQVNAVVEGYNSLLIAVGAEVKDIVEAREEGSDESMMDELKDTNDSLMEQVVALKEKNNELLKIGLIQEEMATLNVVEKEKFVKLAEQFDFDASNAEKFIGQLETLKETIATTETDIKESKETKETLVNESNSASETKEEKGSKLYQTKASHLY